MIHATKATIKRLSDMVDTDKNNYTKQKFVASVLLRNAREAEIFSKEYEEYKEYDPEGLEDFLIRRKVYYSNEALIFRPWVEDEENMLRGLTILFPELVRYTGCLDISVAEIYDINKLTKEIMTWEKIY